MTMGRSASGRLSERNDTQRRDVTPTNEGHSAGRRRLQACDQEAYFPSREMLSICRTMPSPGGQISEMAGYEYCCG
jgi:hypothetical protein